MIRHTSSPERRGSMRSRTITSGDAARKRSSAFSPSGAVCTTNPSRSREYFTLSASAGSSSTSRTFTATAAPVASRGMRGVGELAELSGEQEGNLLADVDRVVAHPFELAGHHVHPDPPLQ